MRRRGRFARESRGWREFLLANRPRSGKSNVSSVRPYLEQGVRMQIRTHRALVAAAVASIQALTMTGITGAAVATWSGLVSGTWSDTGNWVGNLPPVSGDSVLFTGTSGNLATTNDIAGLSLAGITQDVGADPYSVGGNSIAL